MALTQADVRRLQTIIRICEELLTEFAGEAKRPVRSGPAKTDGAKRVRRSGKELVAFRKMLVAERKKGVPVAEIARKHGVSTAYIYQL